MAHLIKDSKCGYFYIRDKKNNFFKSTFTKDKRLARKKLHEYEESGFDKYKLGKSSGYIMNISCCFNELIKFIKDKELHLYSSRDVNNFIVHKIETTSQLSARRHVATLRPAFKYAIKQHYIMHNPFEDCIEVKIPKPVIRFLDQKEFNKLLNVIDNILFKDLAVFAVRSGMRLSEILHLKISDINLSSKFISVLSNEEHETKTKQSRTVELGDDLIPLVKKYYDQTYLFENPVTNSKFTKDYVSHKFTDYIRKAELGDSISFKTFRSTYTTWLLNAGASKEYLQSQLGHSSIRMLETHYGFYDNTIYRGDVNKIKLD